MYVTIGKSLLDFILSILMIGLTLPIQLILFVILAFYNRGNVFFIQKRPGKNEKVFSLIKFKTMTSEKNSSGELLIDSKRITPFGKWLRKYSLDELPQLFLVLIGKMSLVGPRPLLLEYLKKYPTEVRRRHNTKPGITGWAQINGRNKQTWEKRFEYDLWYVENVSLKTDLKILSKTCYQILFKKGENTPMDKY